MIYIWLIFLKDKTFPEIKVSNTIIVVHPEAIQNYLSIQQHEKLLIKMILMTLQNQNK